MPELRPLPPIWRRLLGSLARIVLAVIAGLLICVRLFESKLVFYPETQLSDAPDIPFSNVEFTAADGTHLQGWYIPYEGSKRVFLISHGNAGNIGDRVAMGEFVHHAFRENVFMYDYRGFGRSEGKPSETGLYSDVDGAFAFLLFRGFNSNSIYLIGQSLGTAVAIDLASRERVGGVILEAPFPSVRVLARRILRSIPIDYVMSSRFDSSSKITRVHSPIVVIHGRDDSVIPFDLGQKLFDRIPGPKRFYMVPGPLHEGVIMSLDSNSIREIRSFFGTNESN